MVRAEKPESVAMEVSSGEAEVTIGIWRNGVGLGWDRGVLFAAEGGGLGFSGDESSFLLPVGSWKDVSDHAAVRLELSDGTYVGMRGHSSNLRSVVQTASLRRMDSAGPSVVPEWPTAVRLRGIDPDRTLIRIFVALVFLMGVVSLLVSLDFGRSWGKVYPVTLALLTIFPLLLAGLILLPPMTHPRGGKMSPPAMIGFFVLPQLIVPLSLMTTSVKLPSAPFLGTPLGAAATVVAVCLWMALPIAIIAAVRAWRRRSE